MNFVMCLVFAGVAGALMALQGCINGMMGKVIGTWEGNFMVHAIGLAAICVLLFVFGIGSGSFSKLGQVPWYGYSGGLINVAIIFGVMASIPKIGATNATTAIVACQVATAMLLDLFGLFGLEKIPFSWFRILGLGLLVVGAKLMLSR